MDSMIFSMTGYGVATRELGAHPEAAIGEAGFSTSVSVEMRSVNARFLDVTFRAPDELRVFEGPLREMITSTVSRGKVECRINYQRTEQVGNTPAINPKTLVQLQDMERIVATHFPQAGPLRVGEILRWPGMLVEPQISGDSLREAVLGCGQAALSQLRESRRREGAALRAVLINRVDVMRAITTRLAPLIPKLIGLQQQKLTERLQDALSNIGAAGTQWISKEEIAERIRQEITLYGIRIDIAEELARLETHVNETRHILENPGPMGKRLDFMMQELNREANTLGSKAATKELADAAMELKLLIEQMREQVQNIE